VTAAPIFTPASVARAPMPRSARRLLCDRRGPEGGTVVNDRGFSLVEAVAAMALVVAVVGAVTTALAAGRVVAGRERDEAIGRAAAAARLATLATLPFHTAAGLDGAPVAVTDTTADVAADPIGPGGPGLQPSPDDALWTDRRGYVDYLDASGRALGAGAGGRARAAYVRRWSIGRLPAVAAAGEAASFAVLVAPIAAASRAAGEPARLADQPGVVVLRGARSRQAS
jgi:hypothetical protein